MHLLPNDHYWTRTEDSSEKHIQSSGSLGTGHSSCSGATSSRTSNRAGIRVEACGICHTDAATVTGTYPGLILPRVPGHEVVGRIEALSVGVSRWKIGQRVGVGFIAGEDGVCEPCKRGDTVNCQNAVISGVNVDEGYAEVMIAEARGIVSIPDELSSAEAAPLLCAGITTYNAHRTVHRCGTPTSFSSKGHRCRMKHSLQRENSTRFGALTTYLSRCQTDPFLRTLQPQPGRYSLPLAILRACRIVRRTLQHRFSPPQNRPSLN